MKIKIVLIGVLLVICQPLYAGNIWNKEHEIDAWTNRTLKEAGGATYKIVEVYSSAYKKWDDALNLAYKTLMKKLPEHDKNLLRESQRKWIAYKDAEFSFMPRHIQRNGGSLSKVMTYERMNSFVRSRVIELEAYIAIFDAPP